VLVVGCPRSGTSALLECLLASGELRSVQSEGHILWDEFHHPADRGWDSDALGAGDVSERERAYVNLAIRLFARGGRFVDKTPESCLRIEYLDALFPDATFVFLRRRAAENVSSLMEAWRARPRFVKYELPEPLTGLGELDGSRWSLVLVPGWRDLRAAPLEEVCARQYEACNEAVLEARDQIDESRWIDVAYEDLVGSAVETVRELHDRLGLNFGQTAERHAAGFASRPSRTALPGSDASRERNRQALERVLPRLATLERRLGY
jgi:hypothetical protein